MDIISAIQIDFLRLFAELDNNNNKIDYSKLLENDDEFNKIFWSYYPNIDYHKLHLEYGDWKGFYIEINNHLCGTYAYYKYPIIKETVDLLVPYVFGCRENDLKTLCNSIQTFLKSIS